MTTRQGGRRQRLRRAIQAAHERFDGLIEGAALLGSRASYEQYLRATWTARSASEQALTASNIGDLYAIWPSRRVCDALTQDIFDVSQQAPPEAMQDAVGALSQAEALGVLYVLEGSALGARLLEKQAAAIGMTATFGARHMAHQTAQPRAWPDFVGVLEEASMRDAEEDLCVAAAVATFDRYEKAFHHLTAGR